MDLVVHDLGGPVGVRWALNHQEKLRRLVLLNTLVYPEMSTMVKTFMLALRLPGLRNWISSQRGITFCMRFGVENKSNLTPEVMRPYLEPFVTKDARTGLLKGGQGLSFRGFKDIAQRLHEIQQPTQLIYGVNDRILPDVAETMRRVKEELPQAEIVAMPGCGHFLQEDNPQAIAEILSDFLNKQ